MTQDHKDRVRFFLIYTLVFILVFGVVRFWFNGLDEPSETTTSHIEDSIDVDEPVLTSESCQEAGGTWDACGSACRTNPGDVCIELCVEYCGCETDDQCPEGFSCGDFVEGQGVCL